MGCCVSTSNTDKEETKSPLPDDLKNSNSFLPKHTTSPPPEETVVKEVLSETPSHPKKPISRFPEIEPPKKPVLASSPMANAKLQNHRQHNDSVLKKPRMVFHYSAPPSGELSEDASEIGSTLSESCVSTATAATTEKNSSFVDDEDEVRKFRNSSPAKYRNRLVQGERLVGGSPARRSQPSPGRARSGPMRDASENGMRRGSGMGPDRRSRSPATRIDGNGSGTGLGRCPSGRRTGKSPGAVGSAGKTRKAEDGCNKETKLAPTSDESLENPLVSLECFIFL